jgi:hypothetical protein
MALSPFIDESHFDSVRRAIDVDLTDTDLLDEVIADDVYLGRAAQQILILDPLAATRTGVAEQAIIMATIFTVAALLVPAMPLIVTEQFVDYRVKFDQLTQMQKIQDLKDAASEQIAIALGDETRGPYARVQGFYLARGGRRSWA